MTWTGKANSQCPVPVAGVAGNRHRRQLSPPAMNNHDLFVAIQGSMQDRSRSSHGDDGSRLVLQLLVMH
jgi:hypothetical protein